MGRMSVWVGLPSTSLMGLVCHHPGSPVHMPIFRPPFVGGLHGDVCDVVPIAQPGGQCSNVSRFDGSRFDCRIISCIDV